MRGIYKAAEVELLLGISVDVQKDWNKRAKAQGLDRLGEGNGHRNYDLIDLCFFKLIALLKSRGINLDDVLFHVLRRDRPDAGEDIFYACIDLRARLARTFASHIVGFEPETDMTLYVPVEGTDHFPVWFLSALPSGEHGSMAGADPAVTLDSVYKAVPTVDNVIAVNVSRLAKQLLAEMKEVGEPLLDKIDDYGKFLQSFGLGHGE